MWKPQGRCHAVQSSSGRVKILGYLERVRESLVLLSLDESNVEASKPMSCSSELHRMHEDFRALERDSESLVPLSLNEASRCHRAQSSIEHLKISGFLKESEKKLFNLLPRYRSFL